MKIAIIDCDSVCFSIGAGKKVKGPDGEDLRDETGKLVYEDKTEKELQASADFFMNEILSGTKCTHYIGFIKGRNTIQDRVDINPEYKADRPKESPWWWDSVKRYMMQKWQIVEVNDHEVDDYVNVTRLQMPDSFIVAIDKDLLSLEGTHYNWRKKEWITKNEYEATEYFWKSMIAGDSADNIKGLPGKGPKYAEKLFENLLHEHEILDHETIVFREYIQYFGESKGIEQFYKNYKSLKIKEEINNFTIYAPVKYEKR